MSYLKPRFLFALLLQGRYEFDPELIHKKLLVDQATMGEVLLLWFIPPAPLQDKLTLTGRFHIKEPFFFSGILNIGKKHVFIFPPTLKFLFLSFVDFSTKVRNFHIIIINIHVL